MLKLYKSILVRRKAAGSRPTDLNVRATRVKHVSKPRREQAKDDEDPEAYRNDHWLRLNARLCCHKEFSYILCAEAPKFVICLKCNKVRKRYGMNHGNLQTHANKTCFPAQKAKNFAGLQNALMTRKGLMATEQHAKHILNNLTQDVEAAHIRYAQMVSKNKEVAQVRRENNAKRVMTIDAD